MEGGGHMQALFYQHRILRVGREDPGSLTHTANDRRANKDCLEISTLI